MKISVFGTGMVGETIATKLSQKHEVMVGSRDRNNPKAKEWIKKFSKISLGTFEEAANFGEIIFNCTLGSGSVAALELAGERALGSKIIVDTSNPLDFNKDHEVSLFVCNTNSLAEEIQKAFPNTKVVKALNTLTAQLMVNPALLPGKHNIFLAGNSSDAKKSVRLLLHDNFGWEEDTMIDLGDLKGARSAEMLVTFWVRLWNHYQNPMFNISIVTPPHPFHVPHKE